MKITINENTSVDELEVIINCKHTDDRVLRTINSLV